MIDDMAIKNTKALPIFMHDPATNAILREVRAAVPKGSRLYLIGGAARNALYFRMFGERMRQRDYDVIIMGGGALAFIRNLRAKGFIYGKIRRKEQIVLKKKKILHPQSISDYVVLDIHTVCHEKTIQENLRKHVNFTVNGFVLPFSVITSSEWYKKIIALPTALPDLKVKQLRVNVNQHPADLFACMRFMSKGFRPPPKAEVQILLQGLSRIQKWRFQKNVPKLLDYVGGEKNARQLLKRLGITQNIFDFRVVKSLVGRSL